MISKDNMGHIYTDKLTQVVSQAAIHLHTSVGTIGTAMLDRFGNMIFNHGVLGYLDERTLLEFAMNCPNDFSINGMRTATLNGTRVYAAALDSQHIFIMVGKQLEEPLVNRFLRDLRRVLPQAPAAYSSG